MKQNLQKIMMTSLRVTREYDGTYHLVDLYESTEPELLKEFESLADRPFMELNVETGRKYVTIRAYSNIDNYYEFCRRLNRGIESLLKYNSFMLKTGQTTVALA